MNIDGKELVTRGRYIRIAQLRDEYYEMVESPERIIHHLKNGTDSGADMFTFVQEIPNHDPQYPYTFEWESIAAIPIETYEYWWKKQINDKTRNMVRKASKKGIEIRPIDFDETLVKSIHEIYNESPIRQGKRFKHFGKQIDEIRREHATFLERSTFIGAFYQNELVGFAKMVSHKRAVSLMNIISKIAHRDKAPTNALIAKAVEICSEREIPFLHYGIWSRRSIGDFKMHHAFEKLDMPRYFVPLTAKGRLCLRLGIHRKLLDYIPGPCLDFIAKMRSRWYQYRNLRLVGQ